MAKYSFCGISGSGMSALAQLLKLQGNEVRGSDRSFDQGNDFKQKMALQEIGIDMYPQDGSAISDDLDVLFVSTAVEDRILDVKAAIEKNIPIKKRSDLLADVFHQYKYPIAVAGTSGKTTTTAMVGYVLDVLKQNPCVINGGLLQNYTSNKGIPNLIFNKGDICVIEADESDGSIEKYYPYIGLINNITIDHKPIDELKVLFNDFANRCQKGIVVNADCINSKELTHVMEVVKFSIIDDSADVFASDIKAIENGTLYKLDGVEFKLNLIGNFNVSNALACISVCMLMGIDKFVAAKALEGFLGTKRRLETIGVKNNITVIDDFAHNPDKVLASMTALKDYEGRVLVMFQPHGFSPMRMMGKDIMQSYIDTMGDDDILLVPEIYFAGGTVVRDISSNDLVEVVIKAGKQAKFFDKRSDVKDFIIANAKDGDRIVIMGARDNSLPDFCKSILEDLGA